MHTTARATPSTWSCTSHEARAGAIRGVRAGLAGADRARGGRPGAPPGRQPRPGQRARRARPRGPSGGSSLRPRASSSTGSRPTSSISRPPRRSRFYLVRDAKDLASVAPAGRGAPPWAIGVAYPELGVISGGDASRCAAREPERDPAPRASSPRARRCPRRTRAAVVARGLRLSARGRVVVGSHRDARRHGVVRRDHSARRPRSLVPHPRNRRRTARMPRATTSSASCRGVGDGRTRATSAIAIRSGGSSASSAAAAASIRRRSRRSAARSTPCSTSGAPIWATA